MSETVHEPRNEERCKITPEIAEDWLERYNTDNYRPLFQKTINQYARDMMNDKWTYTADPIKFDWNMVLQDGQTRLAAIVLSNTTQEIDVRTGLEPEARDYMDLGRKRSMSNILGNNGYRASNTLQSVRRLEIDVISIRKGLAPQGRNASFPEIKAMIDQDEDAQWVVDQVRNVPQKTINRTVIAYCYGVFHKIDPDAAAFFLEKLISPANLAENHPLLKMHTRLTNGNWYTKGRPLRLQQTITLIRAWNAYRSEPMNTNVILTPLPSEEDKMKIPEPI